MGRPHLHHLSVSRLPDIPPEAGAAVMATGILSTALHVAGHDRLSVPALWVAVVMGTVAALLAGLRAAPHRRRLGRGRHSPARFTVAAATAVVGTRITIAGRPAVGAVMLVPAALTWAALMPRWWRSRRSSMAGADFLAVVATHALAVLCAALGLAYASAPLVAAGAALLVGGVLLYVPVVRRFDTRQILTGPGDQWVAGGSLAIGALAAAELGQASGAAGAGAWSGVLRAAALGLLAAAAPWYVALAAGEIVRPRALGDVRRWASVFPLGVAAAACMSLGAAAPATPLTAAGRGLVWVAAVAWIAVGAAVIGAVVRTASGPGP